MLDDAGRDAGRAGDESCPAGHGGILAHMMPIRLTSTPATGSLDRVFAVPHLAHLVMGQAGILGRPLGNPDSGTIFRGCRGRFNDD
ncbi:MAG: hypothetical protein AB7G13_13810 [Lautropia sp.]